MCCFRSLLFHFSLVNNIPIQLLMVKNYIFQNLYYIFFIIQVFVKSTIKKIFGFAKGFFKLVRLYLFFLSVVFFLSILLDIFFILPNTIFFLSKDPKDWFLFIFFIHIFILVFCVFIIIKKYFYSSHTHKRRGYISVFILFFTFLVKTNLIFLFRFFSSRSDFVDIFYSKFFIFKVRNLFSDSEKLSYILSFAEKNNILFSLENVQDFLVLDNISDIKSAMISVQSKLEKMEHLNSTGYLSSFYLYVSNAFSSCSEAVVDLDYFKVFLLVCLGTASLYLVFKLYLLFIDKPRYIAENSKPIKWLEEQESVLSAFGGRDGYLKRCRMDPSNLNSSWKINPYYDTNDKMLLTYLVFLLRRCQQRLWTGMSWTIGETVLADRDIRGCSYSDDFRDILESNSFNRIQMVYYWTLRLACICSFDFTLLSDKDKKLLTLLWGVPYLTENPFHWKVPSSLSSS